MSDLISRQAAIDAARDWYEGLICGSFKGLEKRLRALPPAQPEIIRCKDCKHWDGVDTCDVIDAPMWDNDFCGMGEKKDG